MTEPTRLPPHNREAERSVLGAMIQWPETITDWRDRLAPDRFYFDAHQKIATAIYSLYDHSKPIDLITVELALKTAGHLEDTGGAVYLAEMFEAAGFNCDYHAQIVLDKAGYRELAHLAFTAAALAHDQAEPISEAIGRLHAELDRIDGHRATASGITIQESARIVLDNIDARRRGERPACLPTGFPVLDDLLCGGLRNGGLTVLAARTSRGKTALALTFARNVCAAGGGVVFFSLEQAHDEITERNFAAIASVSGRRLQSGDMRDEHAKAVLRANDHIQPWRFITDDRRNLNATQIVSAARRHLKKIGGRVLVVVDYLSLIRSEDPRAPRYQQVGDTVRKLRAMAGTLGVPVLLLAQLNREAEVCEVPEVHHIKESGDVEQDADAILLLHQVTDDQGQASDDFRLFVAKQRNGPKGEVSLARTPETFIFEEATGIPV
jgi:replicative DNA helicase